MLFARILPETVMAPKVVEPPDAVEVSDNQANAFDSPSVGQTYSVLLLVLYQSCPLRGLGGGVLSANLQ